MTVSTVKFSASTHSFWKFFKNGHESGSIMEMMERIAPDSRVVIFLVTRNETHHYEEWKTAELVVWKTRIIIQLY